MFLDLAVNGFDASLLNHSQADIASYRQRYQTLLKKQGLEAYLCQGNNILDAEKIAQDFFPKTDADVFISHSHRDEEDVIKLALSLEKMGLKVFIDSCVWGWADDLLLEIDKKFCIPVGWDNYSYPLRNRTTSNVHLILNSALQNMISRSELLLFIESENSLKIDDYVNDKEYLASPWIFSELMFAKRAQRTQRRQIFISSALEEFAVSDSMELVNVNKGVGFAFPNPGTRYSVENSDFISWVSDKKPEFQSDAKEFILQGLMHLDDLYQVIGVPGALLAKPRGIK